MEQAQLEKLVKILLDSECRELSVDTEDIKVKIVRSFAEKKMSRAKIETEEKIKSYTEYTEIKSVLVGVFHFNKNYAEGDEIALGEKIGYIESLKTKTDVVSSVSGTVAEILTEDNEAVEYGSLIMKIR